MPKTTIAHLEQHLAALELQNKNLYIASYERKQMVLGFMGFAQLMTPGRVIDVKLTKIAIFWEGHIN